MRLRCDAAIASALRVTSDNLADNGADRRGLMRRREFIALVGGVSAACAFAAQAQHTDRAPRIGVLLGVANDLEGQARITAFRQGLQERGWTDGRNIGLDLRFGVGGTDRVRAYAAELVSLSPGAILANGPQALAALGRETRTIPIVFVQVSDPVGAGFVASLARPGGNITGFTSFEYGTNRKFLELLKEIAPGVTQVAVILQPENPTNAGGFHEIEASAAAIGVQLTSVGVRGSADIEHGIEAFASKSNGGLIVIANPITNTNRELIIAARHRLPAIYGYRYFVTSGGLVSYGPDVTDLFRRSASYIDRILKGEKPGDLPIQQPTKFDLVINLKTAMALGIAVPPTLLARADEVIE
jgi:putative ABC transport system substrate-binding protein